MQTFLPFSHYRESAKVLDRARLGKQRVEVYQLLRAVTGVQLITKEKGSKKDTPTHLWRFEDGSPGTWVNHPATLMWTGHEGSLIEYGIIICEEWISRGYNDTCLKKIQMYHSMASGLSYGPPRWVGYEPFHQAHRSNLLRKKPEHYSQYWDEPDNLEYIWPRKEGNKWKLRRGTQ